TIHLSTSLSFFSTLFRPPISTLFPYTTLFRSRYLCHRLVLRHRIVDDIVGKIRGPDDTPLIQHHESLNEILHLSDVSWPVIPHHYRHGIAIHLNDRFPPPARVKGPEMINKERYFRIARAQRWKFQRKNV